jgi:hypothetical protein
MTEPVRADSTAAYERTRLSWRRTILSLAAVALLAGRMAIEHGDSGVVLAAVALLGWPVLAGWGAVRMRILARRGDPVPDPGRLLVYVAGVVAYVLVGLGLVIVTLD